MTGRLVVLALAVALAGCGAERAQQRTAPRPTRTHATTNPSTVAASAPGAHRAAGEAVPVLMYHLLNRAPAGAAMPELWVPREDFAAQVDELVRRGYHAVTLQQVYDAWHRGGLLPSKPIVLSFDDGYRSQYTNAFPILRARGWPGVLNVQVGLLKTDLRPREAREMLAAGWEVDAHTITHADLTTLQGEQLRQEVAGSRDDIRRMIGGPVNFFCYPAGKFDAHVVAAVRSAGYLGATTVEPGLASPGEPPFALKRIRVNGSDGVRGMLASLSAAGA